MKTKWPQVAYACGIQLRMQHKPIKNVQFLVMICSRAVNKNKMVRVTCLLASIQHLRLNHLWSSDELQSFHRTVIAIR